GRHSSAADRPSGGDAGAGLLATTTGVLVFLFRRLFAVQVAFDLYARSAVSAATYDGARIAAGAEARTSEPDQGRTLAEAHVRSVLGRYGSDRLRLRWDDDPDSVVLTVDADNPSFLPVLLRRPLGLDHVHRTARVRIEQP